MLAAPTRLWLPAGTQQRPPRGDMDFPGGSTDWALSLASPKQGKAVLLPDGDVRGVYTPDHPRTAGPWVSPSRSPRP